MTEMEGKRRVNILGERERLNGLSRSLAWSDWWMVDQTNVEFTEVCLLEMYTFLLQVLRSDLCSVSWKAVYEAVKLSHAGPLPTFFSYVEEK